MSTETMKAWVFRSKGHPSKVLNLETDYPKPTPSGDLVLLKTHAVSLNPIGWKLMGQPPISWTQKLPGIPESDVSGTIVEGDLSGTNFKVGDQVFGIKQAEAAAKSGQGVLAEYCLVPKQHLRRKPQNIDFEKSAAVPLAALTALGALLDVGKVKMGSDTGKKVFINGGSGGVGPFAVQIAAAYGCQVSTTCSPASRSLVESLAPNVKVFDYTTAPLAQQLKDYVNEDKKPFDVFFDTIGVPELYHNSPSYLSPKATYIDIAGRHLDNSIMSLIKAGLYMMSNLLRPSWLGGVPRKYKFYLMAPSDEKLNEIERLLTAGSLKPILDETFAFEDAKKAYERSMSGRSKGKVVIKVA
ncbi:hypothetical protein JCM3765_007319 [Sporobolomyces pararoseus]